MVSVIGAGLAAMMGAFFFGFLAVMLALYVYAALALMAIAKKTNTKNGWFAFIPILNVYLMLNMVKLSPWWLLMLLAGIVPLIGGIALMVFFVYLWWKIAEAIHKPGWWGILIIIPVVNLVIMGIMAWGK